MGGGRVSEWRVNKESQQTDQHTSFPFKEMKSQVACVQLVPLNHAEVTWDKNSCHQLASDLGMVQPPFLSDL